MWTEVSFLIGWGCLELEGGGETVVLGRDGCKMEGAGADAVRSMALRVFEGKILTAQKARGVR